MRQKSLLMVHSRSHWGSGCGVTYPRMFCSFPKEPQLRPLLLNLCGLSQGQEQFVYILNPLQWWAKRVLYRPCLVVRGDDSRKEIAQCLQHKHEDGNSTPNIKEQTRKQIQTGMVVCAWNPSAGEACSQMSKACCPGCLADLVRYRFRKDLVA